MLKHLSYPPLSGSGNPGNPGQAGHWDGQADGGGAGQEVRLRGELSQQRDNQEHKPYSKHICANLFYFLEIHMNNEWINE